MYTLRGMPGLKILYGNELEEAIKRGKELREIQRYERNIEKERLHAELDARWKKNQAIKKKRADKALKRLEKLKWVESIRRLKRLQQIIILRRAGLSFNDTGRIVGVSGQRVIQIIRKRKRIIIDRMIPKLIALAKIIELVPLDWEPSI